MNLGHVHTGQIWELASCYQGKLNNIPAMQLRLSLYLVFSNCCLIVHFHLSNVKLFFFFSPQDKTNEKTPHNKQKPSKQNPQTTPKLSNVRINYLDY